MNTEYHLKTFFQVTPLKIKTQPKDKYEELTCSYAAAQAGQARLPVVLSANEVLPFLNSHQSQLRAVGAGVGLTSPNN